MAAGREGYIVIGRETTFGTRGTRDRYLNATESIEQTRERLRESFMYGSRATPAADQGRVMATGELSNIIVRGSLMTELFRACVGAPLDDGETYLSALGNYSELTALPPYTIFTSAGNSTTLEEIVYTGAQGTRLELTCEAAGPLTASVEWLIKDIEEGAYTPSGREQASAAEMYKFEDLTITRNGQPFPFVEAVTITLDNDVQPVEVFNEDPTMVATSFESVALVDVQMTITFRDASTYNEFVNNTKGDWVFTWAREDGVIQVELPKLSIDRWGAPLEAPGRLTVDVYGVAEESDDDIPAAIWRTYYGTLSTSTDAPLDLFNNGENGFLWEAASSGSSFYNDAGKTTIANVGDTVAAFDDLTGNGNHFLQSTAAGRAILREDGQGRRYLEFDGVDDFYDGITILDMPQPFTVAAATLHDGGKQTSLVLGNAANNRTDFYWRYQDRLIMTSANSGITVDLDADLGITSDPTLPTVIQGLWNGVDSDMRVNGVQKGRFSVTGSENLYQARIAHYAVAGYNQLRGRIYGMLVINRDLTESERQRVDEWLASLSGVTF